MCLINRFYEILVGVVDTIARTNGSKEELVHCNASGWVAGMLRYKTYLLRVVTIGCDVFVLFENAFLRGVTHHSSCMYVVIQHSSKTVNITVKEIMFKSQTFSSCFFFLEPTNQNYQKGAS